MLKRLGGVFWLVGVAVLLAPQGASARCTATLTCSNACSEQLTCPSGQVISCSSPNQALSCSGDTSCTHGTASVTCDGVTATCNWAPGVCTRGTTSIQCGNTVRNCPICGKGGCSALQPSGLDWLAPVAPAAVAACS